MYIPVWLKNTHIFPLQYLHYALTWSASSCSAWCSNGRSSGSCSPNCWVCSSKMEGGNASWVRSSKADRTSVSFSGTAEDSLHKKRINWAFRLAVRSSFVYPKNNCDWLKYITWFILANHSCFWKNKWRSNNKSKGSKATTIQTQLVWRRLALTCLPAN